MSFACSTAPGVAFATREALLDHYRSAWHAYNLRRRAAGLAPISREVFESVSAAARGATSASAPERRVDHVKEANREVLTSRRRRSAAREAEEGDVEARVERAAASFEFDARRCIWDGVVSEDVERNLLHMHREHGFHVPDAAYVSDLEGLLRYCAEKVWVGRVCLLCDRTFVSGEACARHMETKGHCRLPWEDESQVEEFLDYFDYSSAGGEEGEGPPRGTLEVDPLTKELVLRDPDGSETRVGHVDLRYQYDRILRAPPSSSMPFSSPPSSSAERALAIYRRAGVSTSSALALAPASRARLALLQRERATRTRDGLERRLQLGQGRNLLIKDRKAGTNVGAGHGVHG